MPKKYKQNKNTLEPNRLVALEGLRGIAAIMVVLFHAFISIFPFAFYGAGSNTAQHFRLEDNFYDFIFSGFLNGVFWVAVFFVLSGFVLSYGYFSYRNTDLGSAYRFNTNQALKRYWRLMIPSFVSIIIAYFIILLGINYNQEAYQITQSPRLGEFWAFTPSLSDALWQGIIGIFYGDVYYNPVLWTMKWELLGSFLVFALVAVFGSIKYRYIIYFILALILLDTYLLGFIIGVFIADLYSNKKMPKINNSLTVIMILASMVLAGFPKNEMSPWNWLGDVSQNAFHWYFIGAAMVVILVISNDIVRKIFSHKISLWFGKQTFSVYLLQDIIILTLMSFIFVKLYNNGVPYVVSGLISILVLLIILLPLSYLYTKIIDSKTIIISRKFATSMLKGKYRGV